MESSEVPLELLEATGATKKYLQVSETDTEKTKSIISNRLQELGVDVEFVYRIFSEDRVRPALLSGTDRVRAGIIDLLDDDPGRSISTPRKEKDLAIMREKGFKPEEVTWAFPFDKEQQEQFKLPKNSAAAVYRKDELEELNPPVF